MPNISIHFLISNQPPPPVQEEYIKCYATECEITALGVYMVTPKLLCKRHRNLYLINLLFFYRDGNLIRISIGQAQDIFIAIAKVVINSLEHSMRQQLVPTDISNVILGDSLSQQRLFRAYFLVRWIYSQISHYKSSLLSGLILPGRQTPTHHRSQVISLMDDRLTDCTINQSADGHVAIIIIACLSGCKECNNVILCGKDR